MKLRGYRWVGLLVVGAIVFYLCWLMVQPMLDVILWSAVLAMVAYPVCRKLRERGWNQHSSALLTTVIVVLTVLVPLTFVTAAVVRQAADAAKHVQAGWTKLVDPNSERMKWLDQHVDLEALRNPEVIGQKLRGISGAIASRTLGVVGGMLGGIVQVFFVLFALYYLLRDSDQIIPAVREALPLSRGQAEGIFRRTGEVIAASVNGVLVIAAIQGFLGMVGFLMLGLPSALLWGVIMFILSTIPMLGAFLVWGPAAIYLLATGHWVKALILTLWGGGVIGMIDNVLRPRLVGKRAKLHELVIFFSVLGGLQVFGILGIFVGPVVAAIALALMQVFREMNVEGEMVEPPVETQAAVVVVTAPAAPQTPEPVAAPGKSDGEG